MVRNKVYLVNWIAREIEADWSTHFIGLDQRSGLLVVSPCIISFDKNLKVGITRNENQFFISGPPGMVEAPTFWEDWCKNRGITAWQDVTKEYYV
jgi:hypothetical protein